MLNFQSPDGGYNHIFPLITFCFDQSPPPFVPERGILEIVFQLTVESAPVTGGFDLPIVPPLHLFEIFH